MAFDILEHRNILIKILKDIYTDPSVGPLLGFKGGTAAYLFYNLGRFSLDLDFDLLKESKADYVFSRVKEIVNQYGKVKQAQKKKFTLFILLSYKPGMPNIKIEINRRNFGSRYEIKTFLGIPMKVMVKEDMFAHKLVAMYERRGKATRDIFDVWFFLKNGWGINEGIIKKRTGVTLKEFLKECINLIQKIPEKGILGGMGELLDEKTKRWAKTNLKKDLLFLLNLKLENLSSIPR